MGVTVTADGIAISVHAPDAESVTLCLFDAQDREIERLPLPDRVGGTWQGRFSGVPAGMRYGLRASGRWDPPNGMRFNPAKLLVDPWATALDRAFRLHPSLFDRNGPQRDDTAPFVPKAIMGSPQSKPAQRVDFDWDRQVIYELHVRGFTMTHPDIPADIRGTYAALGHPASIAHLKRLGVSTIEIMPSAAWADERHLAALNLTNYWGYNPMAFLAPDPRLAPGGWAEVRAAVDALHEAGLSVILDTVLNHTAESDERGPTLSLRGLDNAGYYRLADDKARYVDDAGCGNVLAMDRPVALRLGLDALRAWAVYGGFDGFRLDLATTLGRDANGFNRNSPFLAAIEQDPLLSRLVFIAEPWDIGRGGYQLGSFPGRWGEWNDHFRDTARRFWRGDSHMLGDFTTRVAGSADIFRNRPLTRSINFITAHDGFTASDLVSYKTKHNEANGEGNRDGTTENYSWNNGAEGLASDPRIQANRKRDVRALLATLLLSRGTPMLTMGDEAGRTQRGNNNAYAQDNARSWFDWPAADEALIAYTADLIALRRSLAPLFDGRRLTGTRQDGDTGPDVIWRTAKGAVLTDWDGNDNRTLIADLCHGEVRALIVFHADQDNLPITLPPARDGYRWTDGIRTVPARSVVVFREEAIAAPKPGPKPGPKPSPKPGPGVTDAELTRLANMADIEPHWWEVTGTFHAVTPETQRALLTALRLPAGSRNDWQDSLMSLHAEQALPLPRVIIARPLKDVEIPLGLPRPSWIILVREDGSQERFRTSDRVLRLPPQPPGRHRLLADDDASHACTLTVAPDACYLPPALMAGERRFGIAAHLYSLRSSGDQGIGDFSSLAQFAKQAARTGAAVVGLNPLHAMSTQDRERVSPYHPSDRRFLDPIYIDVSRLPGGEGLPRVPGPVDYPAVWARKRAVLRKAFQPVGAIDPLLRQFATFEAIGDAQGSADWRTWPEALRHPDSPAVRDFAAANEEAIQFHAFVQKLADQQLGAAARDSGLSIGFYRDLAVGAAPDGAEAWAAQDLLMSGCYVGAPPDPFSQNGQNWCLPPPDPIAMRRNGYAGFNELLVANMRHAGALRIDHVMGIRRLFVIPDGAKAAEGAYVRYPMDDLMAQITLESQRARCLVVGEDLGTVPEGFSDALGAAGVLSYSVLWFERDNSHIKPPPAWKRLAAACVSTHDLPTLAGWWQGADITEKQKLGLIDDAAAALAERKQEIADLVRLLRKEGLLDAGTGADEQLPQRLPRGLPQGLPASVAAAVHAFVAATPALLALVQADDLAGETVAVNLPGTDRERPNWRRRLEPDVEALLDTPLARAILAAMRERAAGDAKPGAQPEKPAAGKSG